MCLKTQHGDGSWAAVLWQSWSGPVNVNSHFQDSGLIWVQTPNIIVASFITRVSDILWVITQKWIKETVHIYVCKDACVKQRTWQT